MLYDANEEIRWAPRVPRHKIRRLYQIDGLGLVDDELIDDVGYSLYARCQSILAATEAHAGRIVCPRCGTMVARPQPIDVKDQVVRCPNCLWQVLWGDYQKTYQHKQLTGAGALYAFQSFVEQWELKLRPKQKMLAIDQLIHSYHWDLKRNPTRPAAVNVIEGSMTDLVAFLDSLEYGAQSR